MRTPSTPARRRGSASVAATFLALALGGLSFGLLVDGMSGDRGTRRTEANLRALEAAETAIARAEQEISAKTDPDGDGIGTMRGTYASASFDATATQDPAIDSRWIVRARGTHGLATREIEVGLKRLQPGTFVEGLFSHDDLVFDGVNKTDAYDSRKGDYPSQAVNSDAGGTYAEPGGNVGSNSGFIELNGSSIYIRGDAIPGPLRSVQESGNPTVTGDTTPRQYERDVPPTPLSEFQAAVAVNQNGTWTQSGGNLTYNAGTRALSFKAGGTLTLGAGTYFFSSITVGGNSTLEVTGEVKIYVTGSMDLSGGSLVNATGVPANLQIYAHPYALPSGFSPTTTAVKIAGGDAAAFVMYGPSAELTLSGGSHIFGAAVAEEITINGNCWYHYDKALDEIGIGGSARIQRLYWREAAPPRR